MTASPHARLFATALLASSALLGGLTACRSPVPPAWQTTALSRTEEYRRQALLGQDTFATLHYDEAARALRSAADLPGLARLELNRQALAVVLGREVPSTSASRTEADAVAFSELQGTIERTPALHAYANWLNTTPLTADQLRLLPAHHQASARAQQNPAVSPAHRLETLRQIQEPFAALLATSLALRAHPADTALRDLAIKLAGDQGWTAPLRLHLEARLASLLGGSPEAANVRARLALLPVGAGAPPSKSSQ